MEAPTERMTAEEIEAMRVHALGYSQGFTPTYEKFALHIRRLVAELRAVTAERDQARLTLASLTTDDGGS